MRQRILVIACAALALAGCNATTTSDTPEAVPLEARSGPATFTAEPGDKPEGRFYAVIGGDTSNDNRLYELGFTPPSLKLLTDARRVSSVGACRERVVVAAGQPEVGYSDHIQQLGSGTLQPLEGLGEHPGFTPELDERCRMAYTWVDRGTKSLDFELRVWEPEKGSARTLYRAQPGDGPLVNPDWGPDGEVVVVRQAPDRTAQEHGAGRPPALIIVRPDGRTSEVAVEGNVVGLASGKQWIALMDDPQGTVFIDRTGSRRAVLGAWYPLTWSPDGEHLLVHDAATRRTLGVVDASDLTTVKPVGQVSGPAWDVDWLPAQG